MLRMAKTRNEMSFALCAGNSASLINYVGYVSDDADMFDGGTKLRELYRIWRRHGLPFGTSKRTVLYFSGWSFWGPIPGIQYQGDDGIN